MKIADDLYGIQTETTREIVWDGGSLCYVKRGSTWEAEPCREEASTRLAHVKGILQATDGDAGADVDGLDEKELEALKALGYIH